MVKGLDIFRRHFDGRAHQFVLIGGTAATLAMEGAGLEFRATKDLDIVLHIEAVEPDFGRTFWEFLERGGYQIREASETGRPVLYRFHKPTDPAFPFMLELFCRAPDGIRLSPSSRLTPISFDESTASLSAILLDEPYYRFIVAGRRELDGLPWIGEDRLIPLKARAWLDLSERKARGEEVDSKSIRKHANDVIRLSRLLSPESRIPASGTVVEDLSRFLKALSMDETYSPKALGFDIPLSEIAGRIAQAYGLAFRA